MKKHTRSLIAAALLALAGGTAANAQTIYTIAGTGIAGFSGDGGLCFSAKLSNPTGVAVDPSGNVYIADKNNGRVRKINAVTGNISTFAGTGSWGPMTLGGPAVSFSLEYPYGVYADAAGDILITDFYRDMTFNVDHTTGNIFSRLGCGTQGNDGDGGPADLAKMMLPRNACKDAAGNTYIADGSWLRKVNAATGIASTVATMPCEGAFIDPLHPNDLYVSGANMIKKINLSTGAITIVAGTGVAGFTGNGGMAITATLSNPGNIFIDEHNILYVCDRGNHAIREINLVTGTIFTIAGNGAMGFSGDGDFSPYARLNNPEGVWVNHAGYIYIADAGNQRVRVILPKGLPAGSAYFAPKGLQEPAAAVAAEVSVYPNPSTGSFTLSVEAMQVGAQVNVYNVTGQLVYSTTATELRNNIDLGAQPAGIYTLTMKSATGTYSQKLTKQ